ncbi:hypothetical protein GCM10009788_40170 [Nocardioides humi]|uniref:Sortase family protein n=1 Tax=Nocardioides humi TaxID=449461 RepID=A0ABN2B554_9ACTN
MDERRSRRRDLALATGVGALVLAVVLAWLLLRDGPEPAAPAVVPARTATPTPTPAPAPAPEPVPTDPCARPARTGFAPTSISIDGVVRRTRVLALPRDAAGVPGVPPVSDKASFAWDRGGVEPGSTEGHVLLNAHTWPDGTATGNRLLDGLEVGGRIVLRAGRQVACYTVAERTEVPATARPARWDAVDGPPAVVIVVCSGKRLGPGSWTHRTLWVATPVPAAA